MRDIFFTCETGKREGKYFSSEIPNAPAVLVLHPHPLHGGTMNNKVVYRLFHTFIKNGFSAMRFNFRGVGRSSGIFDHGMGELIDAATALDWLQNANSDASSYWVAGFSFGAWIGLQLVMRRPEVKEFVAISPPANSYDFSFFSPCPTNGLVVQGTADTVVSNDSVSKLVDQMSAQQNIDIQYNVIEFADHFFNGKLDEVENIIDEYIKMRSIESNMKSQKRKKKLLSL